MIKGKVKLICIVLCLCMFIQPFVCFADETYIDESYTNDFTITPVDNFGWISAQPQGGTYIPWTKSNVNGDARGLFANPDEAKNSVAIAPYELSNQFTIDGQWHLNNVSAVLYLGGNYKINADGSIAPGWKYAIQIQTSKLILYRGNEVVLTQPAPEPKKSIGQYSQHYFTLSLENGIINFDIKNVVDNSYCNSFSYDTFDDPQDSHITDGCFIIEATKVPIVLKRINAQIRREIGKLTCKLPSETVDIDINTDIAVTFNKPVTAEAIAENYVVEDENGNDTGIVPEITVDEIGKTAHFLFDGLDFLTKYVLRIKNSLCGTGGEKPENDFVYEFTTRENAQRYKAFFDLNDSATDWDSSFQTETGYRAWSVGGTDTSVYADGYRNFDDRQQATVLGNALYTGIRFKGGITYTGKLAMTTNSSYVYFNALYSKNELGGITITSGYRIEIYPRQEKIVLCRSDDGNTWTELDSEALTSFYYKNISFRVVVKDGTISAEITSDANTASLYSEQKEMICDGFIGIGARYSQTIVKELCVSYHTEESYIPVKINAVCNELKNYSMIIKNDSLFWADINKKPDELSKVNAYIDDLYIGAMEYDGERYFIRPSELSDGAHTFEFKIYDLYNDCTSSEKSDFCIANFNVNSDGFRDSQGNICTADSHVSGQKLSICFNAQGIDGVCTMICLYDSNGTLKGSSAAQQGESAEIQLPQSVSGMTVSAFAFRSFSDTAPISGSYIIKFN